MRLIQIIHKNLQLLFHLQQKKEDIQANETEQQAVLVYVWESYLFCVARIC